MPETITTSELREFLNGVVQRLAEPQASDILSKWNDDLASALGEGFLDSQSSGGIAWAPPKHPRPPGHNPGTRPLIDTGKLMQSVISNSSGHIETVTQDSTLLGTSVFYAAFHQYGTGTIPARPFIGISEDLQDSAAEKLGDHIMTVIDAI